MTEMLLTDRRKTATANFPTNLKRSKSVRASLRQIGNRFLSHKNSENRPMSLQKSPSLQSLQECNKPDFRRNFFNINRGDYTPLPDLFEKQQVNTILKTPMIDSKDIKNHQVHNANYGDGFQQSKDLQKKIFLTQPPSMVAPKAAALLQIPTNQGYVSLGYQNTVEHRQSWFLHKNGKQYDLQGRFDELETGYRAASGFQRNSLRLSITTKRKNGMWNSSFSSSSSRFEITYKSVINT